MKVLHVAPSFYPAFRYGGPTRTVYGLCKELARQGAEVRVLTTDANGPESLVGVSGKKEELLAPGFSVRYCRRVMRGSVSVELLWHLLSSVRWADVVHLTAVYSFPTIPTLQVCRRLEKPVIWSPRGALQRWKGSTRPWLKTVWECLCKRVAPNRTILHVTSMEERRDSQKRFPDFEAVVVPNGVEMPADLHSVTGNGTLRLLFLGRLHPVKGVENLLEACRLLEIGQNLTWSLTIAGTGEADYVESLRSRISALGLSQKVVMVGEIVGDAKQRLFEHADLTIVPSFMENFGLVVAESLAHGVPVIASKGTPWEGLERVGCGLWVDQDPDSLAKAIELASRMPLREMGGRGRAWMKKDFSWDSIGRRMAQLYRSTQVPDASC
jgi:glycosyltransferase involved in cell wall biosynthesis